jgi:hypothetical protein
LLSLSVRVIVTLPEKLVVGVPEITPVVEFRESPEGRLPLLIDQVEGETPSVLARVKL